MEYKCFNCGRIVTIEPGRKRIRCPYCGGKILYKQRSVVTKVKAR